MRNFAKRFAKYVHCRNRMGCLVHEVVAVELHWKDWHGERLATPEAAIHTKCGAVRYSRNSFLHNTLEPGMVECRKCKGLGTTVSGQRDNLGPSGVTRKEATDRLRRLASREGLGRMD